MLTSVCKYKNNKDSKWLDGVETTFYANKNTKTVLTYIFEKGEDYIIYDSLGGRIRIYYNKGNINRIAYFEKGKVIGGGMHNKAGELFGKMYYDYIEPQSESDFLKLKIKTEILYEYIDPLNIVPKDIGI